MTLEIDHVICVLPVVGVALQAGSVSWSAVSTIPALCRCREEREGVNRRSG